MAEPYIFERNGWWHVAHVKTDGSCVRRSLKTKDRSVAEARLAAYERFAPPGFAVGEELEDRAARSGLRKALRRSQDRARLKGLEHDLTFEDLERMYVRQRGRCAVTQFPFREKARVGSRNPFAVSIDRMDCAGGYVLGNVRLVLVFTNWALSDWGEDVFWQVVEHAAVTRMGP